MTLKTFPCFTMEMTPRKTMMGRSLLRPLKGSNKRSNLRTYIIKNRYHRLWSQRILRQERVLKKQSLPMMATLWLKGWRISLLLICPKKSLSCASTLISSLSKCVSTKSSNNSCKSKLNYCKIKMIRMKFLIKLKLHQLMTRQIQLTSHNLHPNP